jgi:hypothetical protein
MRISKACEVLGWSVRLLNCALVIGAFAGVARAQGGPPWWVGMELGGAELQLSSDQVTQPRAATFGLGFVGGHSVGKRARVGLQADRWLLQNYSLFSAAVGESISNLLGVVDAFPARKKRFFLRAGAGYSSYTNKAQDENGTPGWSWTAGAGYEFRLRESFGLAPVFAYSAGSLGDVRNALVTETGRRFSAIEFKVDLLLHFGGSK